MSRKEEIIQIVSEIADMSTKTGFELLNYANELSRFVSSFSSLVNGSNNHSAKLFCIYLVTAQKELSKAAKATLVAGKIGQDWCDARWPTKVLKKIRR